MSMGIRFEGHLMDGHTSEVPQSGFHYDGVQAPHSFARNANACSTRGVSMYAGQCRPFGTRPLLPAFPALTYRAFLFCRSAARPSRALDSLDPLVPAKHNFRQCAIGRANFTNPNNFVVTP